jgi:hypothetical protein
MPLQFLLIKALFFFIFGMSASSTSELGSTLGKTIEKLGDSEEDKISVRESTTELQVTVGQKIFVFGKAKGTLDKIKVGMNVLFFSQATEAGGYESTFSKVNWKKLKDGSIQIQSSYHPWPQSLSWIVFADGRLKLEASAAPADFVNSKWLGLGFNFPDQLLYQIFWNSSGSEMGQWKNSGYVPMADPELEIENKEEGFFKLIRSVRMEFESVNLEVSTETNGVYFGMGKYQNQTTTYPFLNTDMVFLFNQPIQLPENTVDTPSEAISSRLILSEVPLVLWFHFQ